MSDTKKTSKLNLFWALAVLLAWISALGATWYLYKSPPAEELKRLTIFVGRFHVVLVHLPMGIVALLAIMEFMALRKHGAHLNHSTRFVAWVAALSALAASWMGYALMRGENVAGALMDSHLLTGLGAAFACWGALFFKILHLRWVSLLSLLASLGLTGAAGHYGGAMVHSETYLAEHAPAPLKPFLSLGSAPEAKQIVPESKPLEQRVVYADIVAPMLEAKCTECHSASKNEGSLRLDIHEELLKAGDSENLAIVPGKPEESELLFRVELPSSDPDYMPTKNKPGLTSDEIGVLKWWIASGASQEKTVSDLKPDAPMLAMLKQAITPAVKVLP